jgi:hypothetical protein
MIMTVLAAALFGTSTIRERAFRVVRWLANRQVLEQEAKDRGMGRDVVVPVGEAAAFIVDTTHSASTPLARTCATIWSRLALRRRMVVRTLDHEQRCGDLVSVGDR